MSDRRSSLMSLAQAQMVGGHPDAAKLLNPNGARSTERVAESHPLKEALDLIDVIVHGKLAQSIFYQILFLFVQSSSLTRSNLLCKLIDLGQLGTKRMVSLWVAVEYINTAASGCNLRMDDIWRWNISRVGTFTC